MSKIYSSSEIQLLMSSENSEMIEAEMWSVKETVYKASETTDRRFCPKSISIHSSSKGLWLASFEGVSYLVNSKVTKNWVVSWTGQNEAPKISESIDGHESKAVRGKIIEQLTKNDDTIWEIKGGNKTKPILYKNGSMSTKKVSISHHEGLIAFVMCT